MRVLVASILFLPYLLSLSFNAEVIHNTSNILFAKTELAATDTLVKMERTVCFGTCPSYELTIQKNGKVTFIGKEFVEVKGRKEGKVSDENVEQLIEAVKKSHFMEIPSNPECQSRYTDMPSVFLTIELDGKRNSVTHYHGCKGFQFEEELYELEEAIDSLSGVKKWVEAEN